MENHAEIGWMERLVEINESRDRGLEMLLFFKLTELNSFRRLLSINFGYSYTPTRNSNGRYP